MVPNPAATVWRKSTYSGGEGQNCVEVGADPPGLIPVRDSKDPAGPTLAFTPAAWTAFLGAVVRGGLSPRPAGACGGAGPRR
jgi:hypothetical protein